MARLKRFKHCIFSLILTSFSGIGVANVYEGKLIAPISNNETEQVQKTESKHSVQSIININKAGLDELRSLPYVGAKRAEAIIKYREENGPFKTIDDVAKVRNISSSIATKLEGKITFR